MKKIELETRTRILISVGIVTFFYLFFQRLNLTEAFDINTLNFDFLNPIMLALITYLCMYWIAELKIKGERFITILAFPAVGIFVFALFVELIINTIFGQLGVIFFSLFSGAMFAFFSYILFSTANILNVSHQEDIPLGQAARAAYYILNMVIEYLLFLIIISNDILIFLEMALIFVFVFYFVMSTLWTIRQRVGRRIVIGLTSAMLLTFTHFVLSFWPIDNTYISLVLLVLLYMLLGVALETREKVSNIIWIEYGLLLGFVFLILITVSSWGINGPLI